MEPMKATRPRFDWYSGSFEPSRASEGVVGSLVDEAPLPCRPRNGYEHAWELRRGGVTVARMMSGSAHEWPYVEASGRDAVDLSERLRGAGIEHRVARADACVDVVQRDAYAVMESVLVNDLPERVTRTQYVQTKSGETASTLYLGSRKSEVFARVYEKGKESPGQYAPETVRMEVQARPGSPERKAWASSATPQEIMSVPKWAGVMLGMVALEQLPTPPRGKRVSDLDGALAAMAVQYKRRVYELLERNGGDLDLTAADLLEVFGLTG